MTHLVEMRIISTTENYIVYKTQIQKEMKKLIAIVGKLRLVQIIFVISVFGFMGHVDDNTCKVVEIIPWMLSIVVFGIWSIRLMVNHR